MSLPTCTGDSGETERPRDAVQLHVAAAIVHRPLRWLNAVIDSNRVRHWTDETETRFVSVSELKKWIANSTRSE